MKLFRFISVLLVLTIFIFSVNGQSKVKKSVTTGKVCKSNAISFPCPKGFQTKSGALNKVFAAFDTKNKIGVYVFDSTDNLSEQNLIDETLTNALKTLYSADYKDYEWKDSNDYSESDTWSKFETAKFAKVGFNKSKQQTIHIQFVRLSFNKKDILAGFVYELANNKEAEQEFKKWSGGGFGEASDALQDLVVRITGEKKTDETPGGPPPMKRN